GQLHPLDPPCNRRGHELQRRPAQPPHRGDRGLAMSSTMILAFGVAVGVLMIFIGLPRTPSSNTALNVQQRLAAYGGEKPLTVEEIELQRPFSERVLRPSIERLGSLLSRSTPQKARQDLMKRLELAGRPGNLTPEDFPAVRL